MGRKTWESLPRALPERQNIVVTRQRDFAAAGAEVARSFADALALVRLPEPVFCIGGGELYRAALPLRDDAVPHGDRARFRRRRAVSAVRPRASGARPRAKRIRSEPDGFAYAYVTYERATR